MWAAHVRLAAALTLVTAGICLAPGELRASCGDYLQMSQHAHAPNSGDPTTPAFPVPCRGPHCSARIPLPAVPPVAPVSLAGPRDVLFQLACIALDEPERTWFVILNGNLSADTLAGRLFRPPRVL